MDKPTLITLKKQMYYLLSKADEKMMLESERALLAILKDDIELMVEIEYKYYSEGRE